MINTRKCDRQMDDSGSNVLIEYIFHDRYHGQLLYYLYPQLTMSSDTRTVWSSGRGTQCRIQRLANRIVAFSGKIEHRPVQQSSLVSNDSSNTEEIDLPDIVEGKPYPVEITYTEIPYRHCIKSPTGMTTH